MTNICLDVSVLDAMFGDDDAIKQAIFDEFKVCADPIIADMDAALAVRSCEGVRAMAHKLKSSARTIGAIQLGDVCDSLESAGIAEEHDAIRIFSDKLRAEMSAVLVAIETL
jgi:HPt (histidine-containing phosphotransfer) domain-containing protein